MKLKALLLSLTLLTSMTTVDAGAFTKWLLKQITTEDIPIPTMNQLALKQPGREYGRELKQTQKERKKCEQIFKETEDIWANWGHYYPGKQRPLWVDFLKSRIPLDSLLDSIETLEEIDEENRGYFMEVGCNQFKGIKK